MAEPFSTSQLHTLERTERVASVFSLLGASFIILTFILSDNFRKPVNRLIFYASWGNLLGNCATLLSQTGVRAGPKSALCQFQAFLIQMFFLADALWNLSMAVNVYLTVFKKYNAKQLKALEWRYHLLCYGTPFIIAFVYCFVDTPDRGKIYGPAQLWCWIAGDWAFLRIALFYGPAWICIVVSFTLYVMSGREIFRKREELRAFREPSRGSVEESMGAYKTTEVSVISEVIGLRQPKPPPSCFDAADPRRFSHDDSTLSPNNYEQFSTTINSSPPSTGFDPAPRPSSVATTSVKQRYRAALEANTAAWRYTKVALLFFVSLCVTWIPSSINRVYDLAHPTSASYPLNFVSSLVLPLMGFWNAVIYFVTTRAVCKALFWDLVLKWAPKRKDLAPMRMSRTARRPSETHSVRRSRIRGESVEEELMGLQNQEKRGADAV
ncbi:MAG: hypothetical protein Q9181_003488 [Wetmoreana brouardii]